ncbi:N-ethylmaleimide reductase [compost metagenome]
MGSDRVGIKISPEMNFNDIVDANPQETYTYLVDQLQDLNLAYLHVALFGAQFDYHAALRPRFKGSYLIGSGLTKDSAEELIASGKADAAVFGSSFLANPDLPDRFRAGAALNTPNKDTFYAPGAEGFIDYPTMSQGA